MQGPQIDFLWPVVVGTSAFFILVVTLITVIIINQRKFISSQKAQMEALQKREEKYRTLFEELNDAVVVSTPSDQFLDVNSAGLDLFGYSTKEEFCNNNVLDLYINIDQYKEIKNVLKHKGEVKDFEVTMKRKDGQILDILATASLVYGESGNTITYQKVFRDVTEKKKLEEQLRQAQKMESVGTLASGVAHDFNNLLAIIIGYTSFLQRNSDDAEKRSKYVSEIAKAAERGAALVKHLLTFARKTEPTLSSLNVNMMIEDLCKFVRETFPKTITFSLNLDANIPLIAGDSSQFHQALLNLVVNARDAMEQGGNISFSTKLVSGIEIQDRFPGIRSEKYVCILVSDTGSGMDEKTRSRIFEPFFTTKEVRKGTGLGLSVVYDVIKNHSGFIEVGSEEGKGTTFSMYFPTTTKVILVENIGVEQPKEIPHGSETILVVEDEEALLTMATEQLEEKGYNVITAKDGMEAVEKYKENYREIAVVLSDLGLPKMGGLEAYHMMRSINPKMKIVFASGFISPEVKNELLISGARALVQKPYRIEELSTTMRKVMDSN